MALGISRNKNAKVTTVVFQIIAIVFVLFIADQIIEGMEDTDASSGPINFNDENGTFYDTWTFLGLNASGSSGIMGVIGIIAVAVVLLQLINIRF